MALRVENVRSSKRKREIEAIYTASFPKEERMPFPMMVAMSCLWSTEFSAYYDGDVLCGLVYMANLFRQSFIMFFAVDPALRSKGYGSRILSKVQEKHPKNSIMVSIEPCDVNAEDLQLRRRRRGFYQRNGYERTGYYIKLGGIKQELLMKNGSFRPSNCVLFFILYSCFAIIPRLWKMEPETLTD